jgi:hypothetical protein
MKLTVNSAIATFGARAKEKLAIPAATGQPENQLRAPFEHLLSQLADLCNLSKAVVSAVCESSVGDLKTRVIRNQTFDKLTMLHRHMKYFRGPILAPICSKSSLATNRLVSM